MPDPSPLLPPAEAGQLINGGGSASAEASAQYGHLSVFATAGSPLNPVWAEANASYSDSIVVTGVPAGVIRFTVTSSGFHLLLPDSYGGFTPMLPGFSVNGNSPFAFSLISQDAARPYTQVAHFDQPFVAGEIISFGAVLGASAAGLDAETGSQTHDLAIQLLAVSGEPLWNAVGTTESGAVLSVGTPEPGGAWLVMLGIAGIWRYRWSRRANA